MGEIQVTQQTLESKRDELSNLNEQFKKKVDELVSAENTLTQMWEGDSHDAFHTAFQSDKGQMDNFYTAIKDYVTKLDNIIERYAKAENANLSTASERNYK